MFANSALEAGDPPPYHPVIPQSSSIEREITMDRHATAVWKGAIKEGSGALETQSGALVGLAYSFKTRFVDESGKSGTNPEELIAAAHAGCFSMQLSGVLTENGTPPTSLDARSVVTLVPGTGITQSALTVTGTVPGIDAAKFKELAEKAKTICPVSKALGAISITLDAKLG
jgi:osmotically inducible protein OsmC